MNSSDFESFLNSRFRGPWWAVGNISGTPELTRLRKKIVKQTLGPYGKITFMSEIKQDLALWLLQKLKLKTMVALIKATLPLSGLSKGLPTDQTLYGILWQKLSQISSFNHRIPDSNPCGTIFAVPIIPLTSEDTIRLINIVTSITTQHAFSPAISLNPATSQFVECVISIDFDRTNSSEVSRAHECIRILNSELIKATYYPYRIDIQNQSLMIDPSDTFWQTISALKAVLDPNNIIAPKKFNLT